MLNKKALSAAFGVEKDANFKQTVLLLHGDGTNGAQNNTFTDSSTNAFTITRNGNTTQGTFSPFSVAAGEWSNYFDGTGDYLSFANGTFNLGSNDFVIESFFYVTSSGGYYTIAGGNTDLATQTGSSWNVTINNTGTISGTAYSGSTLYQITTTATVSQNVWNHVVFVRTGGTISLFLNGTKDGTNTTLSTASINNGSTTYPPCVGANGTANVFIGYLSNTRIIIGSNSSNVYSASASSITVPTAPLTAVTDTKVLTCRSNRFVDISSSPNTVTPNGNTSVQPFSPFAPSAAYSTSTNGGSGYFDGTGDYLVTPSDAALSSTLLANDFTIECWLYLTTYPSDGAPIWTNSTSNSDGFSTAYVTSTGTIGLGKAAVNEFVSTDKVPLNAWTHFASVRNGSTVYVYLNGVQVSSGAASTYLNTTATKPIQIAQNNQTIPANLTGYISGYRVVASAVYTAAFTPPTATPTAITNTKLLLNFTNAAIFDQTGKNNLETVGNAQIDTGTKKFGTGSMEFDGTGDFLDLRGLTENFIFGTGDFTIEFWMYLNSTTTGHPLDFRPPSTNGAYITLYLTSNTLIYFANTANQITSGTLSTSTWYHVAVSRSGTSTKMFIDGTQAGSTYTDSTNYLCKTNGPRVGANDGGTGGVNGFIDDLRVTKGVARYTANFTPPTKAFPDQ